MINLLKPIINGYFQWQQLENNQIFHNSYQWFEKFDSQQKQKDQKQTRLQEYKPKYFMNDKESFKIYFFFCPQIILIFPLSDATATASRYFSIFYFNPFSFIAR